jgi:hypothetical protein
VPSRFLTVGLILFLAFGGSGALLDRYRTQVAQADAALATVDGSLQAIITNPADAADSLAAAESALRQARAAGADATTLHRQTLAVEAARDQAWGNVRLEDMTLLGALPQSVSGSRARLERTGRDIWLVDGSLYGLDQVNHRLVQVLEPGAAVQGGEINSLRAGVSDGEQLMLLDEAAVITRDATGRWERHFLSSASDDTALGASPLAAYQRSLYALAPDGELLKFAANDLSAQPNVWVSAATYPELLASTDLAIDGEIHVLLNDGRVLTFLRGNLIGTRNPTLAVPWANPNRLVGGLDTNFLYVLDPSAEIGPTTGRIVRLDSAGTPIQILPPLSAGSGPAAAQSHILSQARDFVVDEEAGLIYFTTETELWRAALPR